MGTGADDTTAQRLRLLRQEFVQPVRTGPGDGRSSRPTHAPAPINLGVVDYMASAAAEVDEHMRAVQVPRDGVARPRPEDPADRYEWWRHGTAHLGPEMQRAREAVIYRQGLEYAIAMGDTAVIRRHPCPQCGCWGLYWRAEARRAACVNHYCTDDNGLSRTWELKRLAQEHVARKSAVAHCAT